MKKFLLLTLLTTLAALTLSAVPKQALRVVTATGEPLTFVLDDEPQVSFQGTVLTIAHPETPLQLEIDDVEHLDFVVVDVEENGIDTLDGTALTVTRSGNTLTLAGVVGPVTLYDISGRTAMHAIPADGNATLDLSAIPTGTYILHTGNAAIKIGFKRQDCA